MSGLETIKNLGLEESEAKIYLALLELGPSTVTNLTSKAKITRTLGYHALEKLSWQGLVNKISTGSKKIIYSAEHPRALLQYTKNKRGQWEKNLEKVEELLPDLISLYKISDKPTIKFKQGQQGVVDIYYESLESATEFLCVWDVDAWLNSGIFEYGNNYFKERNRRKKFARILVLDTLASRQWVKDHKFNLRYTEYRWAKPELMVGISDFGGELNIYEDKVNIVTLKKPNQFGVIVQSKTLTNLMRALFELAWHVGEPILAKHKRK